MLSVFPLHFLALLAYLVLRVCAGLVLVYLGFTHWYYRHELKQTLTHSWWPFGGFSVSVLVLAELIFGSMMIAGFYMQVATLLVALMSLKLFTFRGLIDHPSVPSRMFYFLLFGVCLCLTITGAGAFAFDLPL